MKLADVHPFDPAVLADPYDFYRALRAEAPVYREPNTGLVLVASYQHVVEALRNHEVFSNGFARAMGGSRQPNEAVQEVMREGYPPVDTMLTADRPEHDRFRALVNKAFTPRRVRTLEGDLEKLAHGLVDAFADRGRFEALADFAVPLPLTVIADQLGVPRTDMADFKRWTDGFTTQLGGMASPDQQVEAARLIVEFQRYFAERLEEARRAPRDDIISDLVRARIEGERPLDVPESLSILQQLLVAGNETTASAIAEGLWLLIRNPDQEALVREDPERMPGLVEEVLRVVTPTQRMWRVVTEDTVLGGVEIAKGSFVLLLFGSANRDDAKFPEADRFDVQRDNASEHVAFGHGIHFCIAAGLARKEMQVAFRTLTARLHNLRLAPGAEPVHKPNILLRGLAELPLEFDAV